MATDEHEDTVIRVEEEDEMTLMPNGDGDLVPPVQAFDSQGPFSSSSVVDLFKQEQQELAASKTVFISVKGYEKTGLQIKYRMPDSGKELDTIMSKVSRQQKDTYQRNLYVSIDTMVYLCEGLYVQPEGVDEPVMLDPNETGEACVFDDTLATLLGMEIDSNLTVRQVVRRLFGSNELAIMSHAFDLNRWLQNTKADLNLEIWQVGE